jgi:parallel beta-helix repeat protein
MLTFDARFSAKATEPNVFQQFSIQEAINNASIGATISILAGIYQESIIVNKTVKLLGENKETTIIQMNDTDVVRIVADNVYVSGFTIRNGGDGISLEGSSNCTIANNIIFNNSIGIHLNGSTNTTIIKNILVNNTRTGTGCGIFLSERASRNILKDNSIIDSGEGIYILNSDNNTVTRNWLLNNTRTGVCLMRGPASCHYNVIRDNMIMNGACYGIDLWAANYNTVFNNTLKNNGESLHLESSDNNTVYCNNVIDNWKGIYSLNSYYNSIYDNNIVDNSMQVSSYNSVNIWDNGFEGNYWSTYKWIDFNLYGIGTRPYNISLTNPINLDIYPLRSRYIKGDANHDGIVGTADVELLRLAWRTLREEDGYTPYVDFNQDKIVNIKDAVVIGYYWLRSTS